MDQSKKKKTLLSIIFIIVLLIATIGISLAFFNYTRTGSSNTIRVGRIYFNHQEGTSIYLSNVFPISSEEAQTDTVNAKTLSIAITGDTDYDDGIEYLVTLSDVNNTVNNKKVPVTLEVTVTGTGLGTEETGDYYTNRENYETSKYKIEYDGNLQNGNHILVGFISTNTTKGTIEGINGTINIKAYLDSNKIGISDTYDGTESDNMGTTNEWAAGKTIFTTQEWNNLEMSFKIKVEANEGIWVKEQRTLYGIMRNNAVMDNISSTYVSSSTGIDFGAVSSDTNGKGIYMRAGTENYTYPIAYYRGDVYDNNVSFAGFCWLAVRTTDTGGVKLIYNGLQDENGTCTPLSSTSSESSSESSNETSSESSSESSNETSSESSSEVSGVLKRVGDETVITLNGEKKFAFNTNYNSPAYNGYMYGDVYTASNLNWTSGARFGSGFTWDGTNYKLVDAETASPDATHHYSCNSTDADATCTYLRYVYFTYDNNGIKYYITLTGGNGVEEALTKMNTNTNNSNAKTQIDSWYASNMNTITSKLEDTVWCNDRSIGKYNGWSSTGSWGTDLGIDWENEHLLYGAYERSNDASSASTVKNRPSLTCANRNDAFTVSNENGNGKLTYPVALLTADEMVLAGGIEGTQSQFYLNNVYFGWSLSPSHFYYDYASGFDVSYGHIGYSIVTNTSGLRPSVSLKPETLVESGDGTAGNPYKIS